MNDTALNPAEAIARATGSIGATYRVERRNPDGTLTVKSETTWTRPAGPCEWFALCDREATGTLPHPALGDVPVCDRCRARYDEMG